MISVVTNLIDNAVKASRKESKIVLEATPDHLMVQDFGKGIPKEDLEMVTEPFYMVDKSRSRANGGAGLGLAICNEIVKLHQAKLQIMSKNGDWNAGECLFSEGGMQTGRLGKDGNGGRSMRGHAETKKKRTKKQRKTMKCIKISCAIACACWRELLF